MSIVNHTSVQICSAGAARDTGMPPRSFESLKTMRLAPGGSELVPFPQYDKFVLQVLSCESHELLIRPGLVPSDGVMTVDVPEQ
jgi:hypothetical protein